MLGNLIGGFIVILIGVTLLPMIAQQISLATSCYNETNITQENVTIPQANTGDTDSFGRGGTGHFGGYDGKVEHKDFLGKVGSYSMIKTNQSMLNPDCSMDEGMANTLVGLTTLFFALAIATSSIGIVFSALRSGSMV